MNDDEKRTLCRQRLTELPPIVRLSGMASPPYGADRFTKAGILPFLPADTKENWRFCVMKPISIRPELGDPDFQLCKGTRMHRVSSGWQDIKSPPSQAEEIENLEVTALREGMEELGLLPAKVTRLFDLGPASFTSASTKKTKWLWLFAAEAEDENCTCTTGEVAFTTAAISWLTPQAFKQQGREDFYPLLAHAEQQLNEHFSS